MRVKLIQITGIIDDQRRLVATDPPQIAPGPVQIALLVSSPQEDDAGKAWSGGVAREWASDLEDPRQDIYTLNDGET